MKIIYLKTMLLCLLLTGCTSTYQPENAVDAAREFIAETLQGHFHTAKKYLLSDTANTRWIEHIEKTYNQNEPSKNTGLRNASINILTIENRPKTQETIVYFKNSFTNQPQKLKVVHSDNQWLIDLKFSFDSAFNGQ